MSKSGEFNTQNLNLVGPGSNDYGRKETSEFFSRPDVGGIPHTLLQEELRKANENMKMPPNLDEGWEVTEFVGNGTTPQTIKRVDGQLFSIGSRVTNDVYSKGKQVNGLIERFEYSFKGDSVFVYTDWSGVGFNLGSLSHVLESNKLPSRFQIGDRVQINFGKGGLLSPCNIIKVHFTESKVLYDVDVLILADDEKSQSSTRIYNIDSCFVEPAE